MHSDCIILAGGLGTRLRSVVADKPKCMADINGKPFIHYLCKQIEQFNFNKVIFSVGYQKEIVIDYFNQHAHTYSFTYEFAIEDEPLGTGGAIMHAIKQSDTDDFFVMNGDTLFLADCNAILSTQQQKMADCTIALKPIKQADRYGIVTINENDAITAFKEKKTGASGLINGGIYFVFRKSFETIPFPDKFSFEKDYLETMLNERDMFGYVSSEYFIDIGIPEDYEKSKSDFITLFS